MTEELKKTKITLICNSCGKPFNTNIGWALKTGKNLVCRKCSNSDKIVIPDDANLEQVLEIFRQSGLKVEI
ncbi:hypothetical protein M0Q97_07785 [Candidatus Dojkabacteria bacterium]|jgi:peptide subunit release factor 1 (eRF1)|nr:hypothetical protein [Candidatus Dojkabacteria bacterium]